MADVITRLGTDNSALERGLAEAERRVEGWARGVGDVVTGIGQGIGQSLFALPGDLVGSAIANFSRLTDEFDRIGKLASALDETPETIQRLSIAADLSGSSVEQLSRALIRLQRNLADVPPESAASRALETLGLSAQQLREASADEALGLIAAAFAQAEDRGRGLQAVTALLGNNVRDLLPLLRSGAQLTQTLQGDIAVLSEQDVRSIEQFNDQLTLLRRRLEVTFVRELAIPFIEAMNSGLEEGTDVIDALIPAFQSLAPALAEVTREIVGLLQYTEQVVTFLGRTRQLVEVVTNPAGAAGDIAGDLIDGFRSAGEEVEQVTQEVEELTAARVRSVDILEQELDAAESITEAVADRAAEEERAAREIERRIAAAENELDRTLPRVFEADVKLRGAEEQAAFFGQRLRDAITAAGEQFALPEGARLGVGGSADLAALAQQLQDAGETERAAAVARAAQDALAAETELRRLREQSDAETERAALARVRAAEQEAEEVRRISEERRRQDQALDVVNQELEVLRLRAQGREEEAQSVADRLRIEQEAARLVELTGVSQREAAALAKERLQLERQIADQAGRDEPDEDRGRRIRGFRQEQGRARDFEGLDGRAFAGLDALAALQARPEQIAEPARRGAQVAAAQAAVALDPLERLGGTQVDLLQSIDERLGDLVVV